MVLAWSDDILKNINTKDGNPNDISEAKAWFKIKVHAVMGIWWPETYGVDHQVYSDAVRMNEEIMDMLDEKSKQDVISCLDLAKRVTLKHIELCLRR